MLRCFADPKLNMSSSGDWDARDPGVRKLQRCADLQAPFMRMAFEPWLR
jgi:hypothetical protein